MQINLVQSFWLANRQKVRRFILGTGVALLTFGIAESANAIPAQSPLFLANPVVPLAMLNMSKDHQLFMKLYDDYSDITDTRAQINGVANPNYGKFAQDGTIDLTYLNIYTYYGYFDGNKCYTYANNRFEPTAFVNSQKYCDGTTWSGNFLNWATMTRMDAVRKMLYGGYRSKDDTETVLERSFLPHDAHAFAKYYNGTDLPNLIPTSVLNGAPIGLNTNSVTATGITICNTTHASSGMSQTIDTSVKPPLMRIAKGNFSLWASNERWQCTWDEEHSAGNSNNPNSSGIYAFNSSPKNSGRTSGNGTSGTDALGLADYNVRVQVCKNQTLKESNCYEYPNGNLKPRGLLQKYGENYADRKARILFGLMTGSFTNNKAGGVLRKNISDMSDEINPSSGIFTAVSGTPKGIVATLNMLRIRGYSYGDGTYLGASNTGGDNCIWQLNSFNNGQCTNWGNPQSEIYLQALRYFVGSHGSGSDPFYAADNTDNTGINNLPVIAPNVSSTLNNADTVNGPDYTKWVDPLTNANYCAPLNIIEFNSSVSSYDQDQLDTFSSQVSGGTSAQSWTKILGDSNHEQLEGRNFFVGAASLAEQSANINLCNSKLLTDLSLVTGTCPDAPHLKGSYGIAGMAYFARQNDLRPGLPSPANQDPVANKQFVRTYGVELAPAIPSLTVKVPGGTPGAEKTVKILPACANHGSNGDNPTGNCGLVSFRVVNQSFSSTTNTGKIYVNWEESEQGGDFDQDMWGVIDYTVTATNVSISTKVLAQSTSSKVGFGYVLSGTSDGDGFHVWSGANGFTYPYSASAPGETGPTQCNNCQVSDAAVVKSYTIGTSSTATFLGSPLYYAAKWGGYSPDFETLANMNPSTFNSQLRARSPDNDSYFFATDPYRLEDSLDRAFASVANALGAAASVATSSSRLTAGSYAYLAQFRSGYWLGDIGGYRFQSNGTFETSPTIESHVPSNLASRRVLIANGSGTLVPFTWNALGGFTPELQSAFKLSAESDLVNAQKRFNWVLGYDTDEQSVNNLNGILRGRTYNYQVVDAQGNATPQTAHGIIGDIVNSSPSYVAATDYHYQNLPVGGSLYNAFVQTKKSWVTAHGATLYVGANDGMLHAFNADTLEETFAFVPRATLPKMVNLSALDYGKTSNPHQYSVDGPIVSGDAYFTGPGDSAPRWHSIIVGTLGAGGRGVFALDVTDPTDPKLLWEVTNANFPDLGYVMSRSFIAPLRNGRWGVVLANGDSSDNPKSKLIVLDIERPLTDSTIINTNAGVGLSAPALIPNSLGIAYAAYAGDTFGNLWAFDLSNASPSSWTSRLLFTAKDSSNKVQPIVAAPTVGINNQLGGKLMIYVGTGKYFDTNDNVYVSNVSPVHSFYAIADTGSVVTRSNLMQKTFSEIGSPATSRVMTPNQIPSWPTQVGWYMDFPTHGEMMITKPQLLRDNLMFTTLISSSNACEHGGSSWLMRTCAVCDQPNPIDPPPSQPIPGTFNDMNLLVLGIPPRSGNTSSAASSASTSSAGPCADSNKIQTRLTYAKGDGTLGVADGGGVCNATGRQSWRQIR